MDCSGNHQNTALNSIKKINRGPRKMALSEKCFLYKHKDLMSVSRTHTNTHTNNKQKQSMVVHSCNSSTGGVTLVFRTASLGYLSNLQASERPNLKKKEGRREGGEEGGEARMEGRNEGGAA